MSLNDYERSRALDKLSYIRQRYTSMFGKSLNAEIYFRSIEHRINILATSRRALGEEPSEKNSRLIAKMSRILSETKGSSRLPASIMKGYKPLAKELEDYKVGKLTEIVSHLKRLDEIIEDDVGDGKPSNEVRSKMDEFEFLTNYALPNDYSGRVLGFEFAKKLKTHEDHLFAFDDAEGMYNSLGGEDGESTRN